MASRSKTGRNLTTVPIFLLVPQVKLPKRLDLDRDAERAHDSVPGLIVANWVEGRLSALRGQTLFAPAPRTGSALAVANR